MSVINTNVKSLQAQNAISVNNRNVSTAMQQLSTGSRINSAKDDAAGLAISEKMTAQVRGLNQAIRNANDGISLLQTAEGAMVEITNMMQRMRELSVQSANDTNAQEDRNYLDLEFQQLKQEINRITKNTQWNGMNILDASEPESGAGKGKFSFQVGANGLADHKIEHTLNGLTYGNSNGAISIATVTNNDDLQESTFTLTRGSVAGSGGFKIGDVVSLEINGKQFQYTVSESDFEKPEVTAPATTPTNAQINTAADTTAENITKSILSTIGNLFAGTAVSAGTNDNEIVFTGTTKLTSFSVGQSASSGQLGTIADLKITSQAFSDSAINGLDSALRQVNEARAEIGAVINRLTYAADNLANVSMNTSESRSRILDTDYAKTSAELARTQIISQAATAMLAQANQQPQAVLQLLQG
jgi:flagellin